MLRNVPAFTSELGVIDPEFEVPLQRPKEASVPGWFGRPPDRYIELALSPGETKEVTIALQPKGRDFIGQAP
jgi:hypothetical protein